MKTIQRVLSRVAIFTLLVCLATACFNNGSAYTNVIPADAGVILSLDLESITKKSGAGSDANQPLKDKLLQTVSGEFSAEDFSLIERIVNKPSESGIDFSEPLYYFYSPTSGQYIVLKLADKKKLEQSLELLIKAADSDPIEEKDGFSYARINGMNVIYNSSTLLFPLKHYFDEEQIVALLKQSGKESATGTDAFRKLLQKKSDLNLYVSLAILPSDVTKALLAIGYNIEPKDIGFIAHVSSEKGKIKAEYEQYTDNKELKAQWKAQEKASKNIKSTFNKNLPASTLAFASGGLDGKKLYEFLSEDKGIKKFLSLLTESELKIAQDFLSTLNGDITFALTDISITDAKFIVLAETNDQSVLEKLYLQDKSELDASFLGGIKEVEENIYSLRLQGTRVYVGYHDKALFITNSQSLYKNLGEEIEKTLNDTPFASAIKGNAAYGAINIEAILELPVLQMVIGFGGREARQIAEIAKQFSYIEAKGEGGKVEVNLYLEDKDINPLELAVQLGKKFAGFAD